MAFRHYKQRAMWEAQIQDKGKIDGAYLLLKRFKNRLKLFDQALEHMNKSKLERHEFDVIKETLNKNTATTIFNDMQKMLDHTVIHLTGKLD